MYKNMNILIVGVGGQGTLLASRVIGCLAVDSGFDVKLSEVHGMAQRGGSVVTHVKYGEKIYSPLIEKGNADIILSFEMMEALRWSHYLKENGHIIVNMQRINPMPVIIGSAQYPDNIVRILEDDGYDLLPIDALQLAKEAGNIRTVNTALLGVLSNYLDFSEVHWKEAIKQTVPEKTISVNIRAFELGRNLVV